MLLDTADGRFAVFLIGVNKMVRHSLN